MRSRWLAGLLLGLTLAGCPDTPAPKPAAPSWTVRLRGVGDDPAAVTAAVVSIRGCSPKIARTLVEGARKRSLPVITGRSEAQAAADVAALQRAGAQADRYQAP